MASGHIEKARDKRTGKIIPNKHLVVVELGRANNKRPRIVRTVYGLQQDAQRVLTKLLRELDTGEYIEPEKMTVRELLERWQREYADAPGKLSPTTRQRYASIIERHLIPSLGHLRLSRLTPLQIHESYTRAMRTGKASRRKTGEDEPPAAPSGLSPTTVRQHHAVLHRALGWAVRMRLIANNPADAVEPPQPARREMRALSPDEMRKLLDAARETELYVPVVLALTTGMRRGEILALRWRDVSLRDATAHVSRTVVETKSGGLEYKEPKTQSARRLVALPPSAVAALKWQRRDQGRRRKKLAGQYEERNLVVDLATGAPMRPDALSASFRRLARRAKLEGVRFHDLRHTHATALVAAGEHPKVISDRLGHASTAFTLTTYGHVLPAMQRAAAERFEELLSEDRAVNGQKTARVRELKRRKAK